MKNGSEDTRPRERMPNRPDASCLASLRRRRLLLAGAAGALTASAAALELNDIRQRGVLRFGVYKEFAPFSDGGAGIDVDIAHALAEVLQVKASVLPFDADENVDDDLRNMVWRGTVLGYGPADVMLHAPVDRVLMDRSKRVTIFAPYFRERLQIARDVARLPKLASLSGLAGVPVGVERETLASHVLLSADGGRLRGNVQHFPGIMKAIEELRHGRLAAVMGLRSELLAGLDGAEGVEISEVPVPGLPPSGWALGLAIKRGRDDLGRALDDAMRQLIDSGRMQEIFRRHKVEWLRP
jgi:ABC-type amino acid transport substrate-binding protein